VAVTSVAAEVVATGAAAAVVKETSAPKVVPHSLEAMGQLRWAVITARRGWVTKGEVLNALPAEEFARRVRPAL